MTIDENILEQEQLDALVTSAGVDVTRSIVDALIQSNTELLASLRESFASGDLASAKSAAHAIKGSSANLGAIKLAERAKEIEYASRDGDLATAMAAFDKIEEDVQVTTKALDDFLCARAA